MSEAPNAVLAALLAEKNYYEKRLAIIKRMINDYNDDESNDDKMDTVGQPTTQGNLATQIRAALDTLPVEAPFGGKDVFKAMRRNDLEYTAIRTNINTLLLRLEKRGILKKLKNEHGKFIKPKHMNFLVKPQ